jgi:hypothetical protein
LGWVIITKLGRSMEKIAAIVEGHTEEHFVKKTYGAVRVSRGIPNGRTVSTEVIVEAVLDALELVSGDVTKVIILFDREGRTQTAAELAEAVRSGISDRCGNRALYIGVSDRQIENWILADIETMRSLYDPSFNYPGDGVSAKSLLKRLNNGVSLGPTDTAILLKSCSAIRGAAVSESLSDFLRQIDFHWYWARGGGSN